MSAIKLPYFEYPKTIANQADFKDWECSICKEEDPEISGGAVAHGSYDADKVHIDGRKHPVHRYCLLSDQERRTGCPTCRVETDASPIIPLMTKCRLGALRIYHSLPTFCERSRNWAANPINQFYVGIACMVAGAIFRKNLPVSIGMGLQAIGIHQAVQYGSHRMAIARQIVDLAKTLISAIERRNAKQVSLDQLKSIAAGHPSYYAQILPWIESREISEVLNGLKNAAEFADSALLTDQMIRFWRTGMAIGALYFGGKYLSRLEKSGGAITSHPERNESEVSWLFYQLIISSMSSRN